MSEVKGVAESGDDGKDGELEQADFVALTAIRAPDGIVPIEDDLGVHRIVGVVEAEVPDDFIAPFRRVAQVDAEVEPVRGRKAVVVAAFGIVGRNH